MKRLLFFIVLLSSIASSAGDLNLNCFLGSDEGDHIVEPVEFMQTNKLSIVLKAHIKTYIVRVSRKSFFEDYSYEIVSIFNESLRQTIKTVELGNYDDFVQVSREITCRVSD